MYPDLLRLYLSAGAHLFLHFPPTLNKASLTTFYWQYKKNVNISEVHYTLQGSLFILAEQTVYQLYAVTKDKPHTRLLAVFAEIELKGNLFFIVYNRLFNVIFDIILSSTNHNIKITVYKL